MEHFCGLAHGVTLSIVDSYRAIGKRGPISERDLNLVALGRHLLV